MFECLSQFGYFLAQGKVGTRHYRISGCYNKLFATFLNPGKITQSKSLLTPMSERLRDERLKKQKHVKCDFFFKANFDLNSHYVLSSFHSKPFRKQKITTISVSSKVSPCSVSASSR